MYLLLMVVALIVQGTLYPWRFDFARGGTDPFLVLLRSWPDVWDYNAIQDAVLNLLLYAPLGVAAFLAAARKHTPAAATAAALGLGLTLSTAIELLQVYEPDRVGSACDVLFNLAGTVVGILVARPFQFRLETAVDDISRRIRPRFGSPPALLLACWATYQLYPLVPQFRLERMSYEMAILLQPHLADPNSPYFGEIWAASAEWFAAALFAQSLFGRFRPWWMIAAIGFRLAVRPVLVTRTFSLDELLGAALALLLWIALRDRMRGWTGLAMLAATIALRQLNPAHFSHFSYDYSPPGYLVRNAFDCGAIVYLLCVKGISSVRAGALVAVAVIVFASLSGNLPDTSSSISIPVLASLLALALWLRDAYWRRVEPPSTS